MRIDLYNSMASEIANEQNAKQVPSRGVSTSDAGDAGDRTTLSSGSGPVNALVSQAMSSPEIRHEKVQNLQQAISSGKYQLEPDKIAGAMIDEHA